MRRWVVNPSNLQIPLQPPDIYSISLISPSVHTGIDSPEFFLKAIRCLKKKNLSGRNLPVKGSSDEDSYDRETCFGETLRQGVQENGKEGEGKDPE